MVRFWVAGDRFSYVRAIGGWGYGTVLEVNGEMVTARLDCQKEGEHYRFKVSDSRFFRED